MQIIYGNTKTEAQCTSLKAAKKLFGGDARLAESLHSRVNAIQAAEVIMDIIRMPQFRFHNLKGNRNGCFAIDVKSSKEAWRIILSPLNEELEQYDPCNIDELAAIVRIIMIVEVSAHYE